MIRIPSLIALLISACDSGQKEPKSGLAVTEEIKPHDTNGDGLIDQDEFIKLNPEDAFKVVEPFLFYPVHADYRPTDQDKRNVDHFINQHPSKQQIKEMIKERNKRNKIQYYCTSFPEVYDCTYDEKKDEYTEYRIKLEKLLEPPSIESPPSASDKSETLLQWFQQLNRGRSAARSDFTKERTAKFTANHVVIQNRANQFLVWKHKLKSAVWPHDQALWEDDHTEEIYGFHGGALVNGALTCVERIIFNADKYHEFIDRVKESQWIGTVPPEGITDKSAIAYGRASGRHGLTDRVSTLSIEEKVESSQETVTISFDSAPHYETRGRSRYVDVDTKGKWVLKPFEEGGIQRGVLLFYEAYLDINTVWPSVFVDGTVNEASEPYFNILDEITKRCAGD